MPKQIMQAPKMSADSAAAGLALATHLSEQLHGMQSQPMQAPQSPQSNPGQAVHDNMQTSAEPFDNSPNDAKFTELEAKMEQMKSEMETSVQKEISSVKDIIIDALKEDGQN